MIRRFKKTQIQICGDCKGEGRFWQQIEPARHGSDTGSWGWYNCATCDSSGRVVVTREIVITVEPHVQGLTEESGMIHQQV